MTPRGELLRELADLIPPTARRVGIDGVDGAGKTWFASELVDTLRARGRVVIGASADDFHNPREIRYRRGRTSAEGFRLDSYDYASLRSNLLDPLGPGGDGRYRTRGHDLHTDEVLELPWEQADPAAVLVLDGLFLHRAELDGCLDFTIFLDVPFAVTAVRMVLRDGPVQTPSDRYAGGQRLYFAERSPWDRASVVVDNADLERPRIIRG